MLCGKIPTHPLLQKHNVDFLSHHLVWRVFLSKIFSKKAIVSGFRERPWNAACRFALSCSGAATNCFSEVGAKPDEGCASCRSSNIKIFLHQISASSTKCRQHPTITTTKEALYSCLSRDLSPALQQAPSTAFPKAQTWQFNPLFSLWLGHRLGTPTSSWCKI